MWPNELELRVWIAREIVNTTGLSWDFSRPAVYFHYHLFRQSPVLCLRRIVFTRGKNVFCFRHYTKKCDQRWMAHRFFCATLSSPHHHPFVALALLTALVFRQKSQIEKQNRNEIACVLRIFILFFMVNVIPKIIKHVRNFYCSNIPFCGMTAFLSRTRPSSDINTFKSSHEIIFKNILQNI